MNEQATKETESGIFYYTGEQARAESISLSLSLPTVIFTPESQLEDKIQVISSGDFIFA